MFKFKKCVATVAIATAIDCGSPAVASAAPVVPAATSSSDELFQAYAIALSIGAAAFYGLPKEAQDWILSNSAILKMLNFQSNKASEDYARMKASLTES
ncbi:hypothetical protein [Corynebacterium macginleyi]|uniref:hypothetical protein n=1 Tax=Corynebacterium macginleyi TaxID=38290 RepID=UPI00190C4F8A|nr:hypothetical protein [Corynebacterium macginleyi]